MSTDGEALNATVSGEGGPNEMMPTDAAWVMVATFLIFSMQSGFGLLESGCVNPKNQGNIMSKNVLDVILGGCTYWLVGYGLSFGESAWTNPFCGWGYFALVVEEDKRGPVFTSYFFQLSFATTATTILSGAVAERFSLSAYMIYSACNILMYSISAGWLWRPGGFLGSLGVVDVAGSGGVHLCGGAAALVAAYMVGPRLGRYDENAEPPQMGSPVFALLGTLILWWGWLAFNCGSTFGIENEKWKYTATAAVITMQGGIGGGLAAVFVSWLKNGRLQLEDLINGILGSLVSITAGCTLYAPWEGFVIGLIGGCISVLGAPLIDKLRIDDPVSALAVHGLGGIWGMVAVGLFVKADPILKITGGRSGAFKGGGFYLLGVQLLACLCIAVWSVVVSFIELKIIDTFLIKIRMSDWEQTVGADFVEHGLRRSNLNSDIRKAVSAYGYPTRKSDNIPMQGGGATNEAMLEKAMEYRRTPPISKIIGRVTKLAVRKRSPVNVVGRDNPAQDDADKQVNRTQF